MDEKCHHSPHVYMSAWTPVKPEKCLKLFLKCCFYWKFALFWCWHWFPMLLDKGKEVFPLRFVLDDDGAELGHRHNTPICAIIHNFHISSCLLERLVIWIICPVFLEKRVGAALSVLFFLFSFPPPRHISIRRKNTANT